MFEVLISLLPSVLLEGLILGFVYAMIALGYTMVYGVLELINFAHSEIFMSGAVAGAETFILLKGTIANPYLLLLVAIIIGGAVAAFVSVSVERLAYRPLRKRGTTNRLVPLITAIGASFFLQDLVRLIEGLWNNAFYRRYPTFDAFERTYNLPVWLGDIVIILSLFTFFFAIVYLIYWVGVRLARAKQKHPTRNTLYALSGLSILFTVLFSLKYREVLTTDMGLSIQMKSLLVIVVSLAMLFGLNWLVNKTKLGVAIRAVAQDAQTASLMGINPDVIISRTFLIGGFLGGVAGVLFGLLYTLVHPYVGFIPGIKAFTAAVLGGIGNITGAAVGGLVLGMLEMLGGTYLTFLTNGAMGTEYKDILAFVILILILLFRPQGILGQQVGEKV